MRTRSSTPAAALLGNNLFSECATVVANLSQCHISGTDSDTLRTTIEAQVTQGATVYADEHRGYNPLTGYSRGTVNHGAWEYVEAGDIHINSTESMWAVLKRSI